MHLQVQLRYVSYLPFHNPLIFFRLSVQRLRTLQQKKEAQAKSARRDVALLVERGRIETARVKAENSTYVTSFDRMIYI
jgi:hypothetical protein